jgi:hypothetical protein
MEAPLCPHEGFLGHAHQFYGGVQAFRCASHFVVKTDRASRGVHGGLDAKGRPSNGPESCRGRRLRQQRILELLTKGRVAMWLQIDLIVPDPEVFGQEPHALDPWRGLPQLPIGEFVQRDAEGISKI